MSDGNLEAKEGGVSKDPWESFEKAGKEIKDRHQPVNYSVIVGDNRVVLLAENHSNHAIRYHIVRYARQLKEAGITHYAIEADEAGNEVFERLNNGEAVDLSKVDVGPGRSDYEDAIRAVARQGIKIVAIDIDQKPRPSREDREARITENITALLHDPNSKVAVLIGGFHTSRRHVSEGVPYLGRRLMEAQVPTVNVHFAGGENEIPRNITEGVQKAELADREFMVDFRPYTNSKNVPYGAGEADWVIHLPQQPSGYEQMDIGGSLKMLLNQLKRIR